MIRVATWNINSLKVRLDHVRRWLNKQRESGQQIDLLCLQELKLPDDKYPLTELEECGYHSVFCGQKTYNGVAILASKDFPGPLDIVRNIPNFEDPQQRLVAATYLSRDGRSFRIVNGYFPNGQAVGSEKFAYKLKWLQSLQNWLKSEIERFPALILLGDFNIAPEDRDVHDPEKWAGENLVSPQERLAFSELLELGLADAYRLFDQPEKVFSWWDYRMLAFRRNAGLRIDHILLSRELSKHCIACTIDKIPRGWEQPSDHTPVVATLDW